MNEREDRRWKIEIGGTEIAELREASSGAGGFAERINRVGVCLLN
jgi:hypothetical protein